MARGHVIAGVEEVEDDPDEPVALRLGGGGGLAGGLGVALGLEQVALQARVGDEDDAGESDDGGADGCHQVDENRGGTGECDVVETSGASAGRELAVDPHALAATTDSRDEHDVEQPGHEEERRSTATANQAEDVWDAEVLTHDPRPAAIRP